MEFETKNTKRPIQYLSIESAYFFYDTFLTLEFLTFFTNDFQNTHRFHLQFPEPSYFDKNHLQAADRLTGYS